MVHCFMKCNVFFCISVVCVMPLDLLTLPEEQGAPSQGEGFEWVFCKATQVVGINTKQLVAPDRHCEIGPESML